MRELAEKQLLRAGIEIDTKVTPWKRPKALRCECGMPYVVPAKGKVPARCAACEKDRFRCTNVIDGKRCEARLGRSAYGAARVQKRDGRGPMCLRCSLASRTPEQWSEIARKREALKSPEQRSESARKASTSRTPEQRTENARKGGRVTSATRTPEQRKEIAASMTPEQRSDGSRKSWETRRANSKRAP